MAESRRRRGSSSEESTVSRPRRTKAEPKKAASSGWNKLTQKKEEQEAMASSLNDFWLKDGEFSFIQPLHDEPYVYEAYSVRDSKGKFKLLVSQLEMQDHCLLAQSGLDPSNRAAWLILDFRGSWDKDSKEFKWDKPVLKVWQASLGTAQQLQKHKERKKVPLNELVIEVQRTGTGTSTSYNISQAFDDETEKKVSPVVYKESVPDITEVLKPLTDSQLTAMGYGSKTRGSHEESADY